MDGRFSSVDERFDRMEGRFSSVDERFDRMDERFDGFDERFGALETEMRSGFAEIARSLKRLESKRDD
jgi:predicted nuclease with TOPRIM domain